MSEPATDRPSPFEVRTREPLVRGRVFDLVRTEVVLPSGLVQTLDVVEHPGAVAVAAIDGQHRLLLVAQVRPAVGRTTLELPAGRLEPGEDPLEAAHRELEEETGLRARTLQPLLILEPAPGFCSEQVHLFLAEGLTPAGEDRLSPDEDEELTCTWLSLEDVVALRPADAKTLVAALLLQQRTAADTK